MKNQRGQKAPLPRDIGLRVRELESYVAAADPSSYNLFSGVIRSFCFIIE